jgi:hypothetical protein
MIAQIWETIGHTTYNDVIESISERTTIYQKAIDYFNSDIMIFFLLILSITLFWIVNTKLNSLKIDQKEIVGFLERFCKLLGQQGEIKHILEADEYNHDKILKYDDEEKCGWTLTKLKEMAKELGVPHLHMYNSDNKKALASAMRMAEQLEKIMEVIEPNE